MKEAKEAFKDNMIWRIHNMLSLKGILYYNVNNKCFSHIKDRMETDRKRNYENRISEETVMKKER